MNKYKKKQIEYMNSFGDIPINYNDRLLWMVDKYKINKETANQIIAQRDDMLKTLSYNFYKVVLYERPEGAKRPRFRFCKANVAKGAANGFIHVYSPDAAAGFKQMRQLVTSNEIYYIDQLIHTPCIVTFNAYFKTPSYFNKKEVFLAEIGIENPWTKPDFDNIAKKYSDMYNSNVWIDDALTISGTVNKFYSILPRVEIDLRFLNMLQNKHQYDSIVNRVENPDTVKYYTFNENI